MKKIGVVAGGGEIVKLLLSEIKNREVCLIKIEPKETIEKIVDRLKEREIAEVVLCGAVDRRRAIGIGFSKKDDTSILKDISLYLAHHKIKVQNQLIWLKRYLAREGLLAGRAPNEREKKDIELGILTAKRLLSLGIGQTVCVKDGIVVAVEALEGTDRAIERAGELVDGFVVAKCGKCGLETPVVGEKTILTMKGAGARILALCANRVLVLPKTVEAAKSAGITVIGYKV
jgi:hypothetical protein